MGNDSRYGMDTWECRITDSGVYNGFRLLERKTLNPRDLYHAFLAVERMEGIDIIEEPYKNMQERVAKALSGLLPEKAKTVKV